VLQLLNCNNPSTTEEKYLQVIARKTAILFSAAAQLAAVLAGASTEVEMGFREYGLRLGIAFQLIDDALDYQADIGALGKNLGDDLAEGKPTLPLIFALAHGDEAQREVLKQSIVEGDRERFQEVYAIIEATQAIPYTLSRARQEAESAIAALQPLQDSPCKEALVQLAMFSVERSF
jgi:octaprenyl-diphosphate synthase